MARRAGSGVLGRIRKRFVALAVGLLALGFVYASSRRATKAIHARTGGGKRDPGVTDASIQWTNFFGSEGGEEVYGQDDGASVEPDGDGGRTAAEQAAGEQQVPAPAPEPVAPTPPGTPSNSRKPQPSPSNSPAGTPSGTPAATSPRPTASNSGKPVPSSPGPTTSPTSTKSGAAAAPKAPEPKKDGGAAAAGPKKLTDVPQSQMQAAGDFLAPGDVYVPPHKPQTPEERKASPRYDAELDFDFKDTAYVTMAAGEDAGRQVVGLVSSLRASKTRVQDIVVMLSRGGVGSAECRGDDGGEWKRKQKREGVTCSGPDTVAEEIIGSAATGALRKLGAVLQVVDPIPSTQYTEGIPGGRSFFWGMALNKLRVFNMTQYKKVIWMDSDTMVLQNVDNLFKEPMFTGAFTYACCNPNAPAIPSGGLWVLEPSLQTGEHIWRMMVVGKPAFDNKGEPTMIAGTNQQAREYWHWGDMQLVRWYFSFWRQKFDREPLWPQIDDHNHGAVAGLQYYPAYKSKSQAELAQERRATTGEMLSEGWHGKNWDGITPVWRALDARYDQCVGHCECLPNRDMPEHHITLHFSCLQNGVSKPGGYATEKEFGDTMYTNALSCTRHYSWHLWYQQYFIPAYGRLKEPHWDGPPIPGYNSTHDEWVTAQRMKKKR